MLYFLHCKRCNIFFIVITYDYYIKTRSDVMCHKYHNITKYHKCDIKSETSLCDTKRLLHILYLKNIELV